MCVFYWIWPSLTLLLHTLCSVNGKWQPWSLWSGCSKTCGGGSQQRNRICYGPFFGGQSCPGEREEVRRCNEKRCPGQWMGTQLAVSAVFHQEQKPELLFFVLFFCLGFFTFTIKFTYFLFVSRTSWNMWRGQLLQCCMEDDSSWGYSSSTLSS